jgi:hypothetical protein
VIDLWLAGFNSLSHSAGAHWQLMWLQCRLLLWHRRGHT